MTCYQIICCPECQSSDIIKAGFTAQNKQRYRCRNAECKKTIFILDYTYRAYLPGVKKQIINMTINGSGMRDTVRVLKISRQTITSELKKDDILINVNPNFTFPSDSKREVRIEQCNEVELDEQWSFVQNKSNQRWLWYVIDHETNVVIAYRFGKS